MNFTKRWKNDKGLEIRKCETFFSTERHQDRQENKCKSKMGQSRNGQNVQNNQRKKSQRKRDEKNLERSKNKIRVIKLPKDRKPLLSFGQKLTFGSLLAGYGTQVITKAPYPYGIAFGMLGGAGAVAGFEGYKILKNLKFRKFK